jgi:serine phosphatase RsbU (regulator of sigma subunit)
MRPTDAITEAVPAAEIPRSAAAFRPPGDPLEPLVERLRAHSRIDAGAFLVVDTERSRVEPGAVWAVSPLIEQAAIASLDRPYGELPGIVEAVMGRPRSLFLPVLEAWESAPALRERLQLRDGGGVTAWELLRRASVIGAPVRTRHGRDVGVLIAASTDPERPLLRADVATLEALADVAALATEHLELLEADAVRTRDGHLLRRAAQTSGESLDTREIELVAVVHARGLVRADYAQLTRFSGESRALAAANAGTPVSPETAGLTAGALAEVARSRAPLHRDGATPSAHVPVVLGPHLYGLLSAVRAAGEPFDAHDIELLESLARISAAALANALAFEREHRISSALARGFVPESLPAVPGYEVGVLSEPADGQPAGGDVYGAWELPGGEIAVLVGDVSGKGIEKAALSAMARFFIEARSWEACGPAGALQRAGAMLHDRLPPDSFVTAFLGFLGRGGIRYANAGHLSPLLVRAGGQIGEVEGRGLPLGVARETRYDERTLRLDPGDLVLGFTDGLIEARRGGELFGSDRLSEALGRAARAGLGAHEIVRGLHGEVREWAGGLSDDAIAIALRHRPDDSAPRAG